MTFPLVISFYTRDTLYQLEVQNLIASCKKYEIETSIEGIDSYGAWELNCAFKPFFIYQKLLEFKRPLLWVDADAVFAKKPSWIKAFDADLSTRINEELLLSHPSKVISGTVYVNYTPASLELLRLWIEESKEQLLKKKVGEEFWDQIALRDVLYKKNHGAKFESLPLSYTKIFDHKIDLIKAPDPVIEHYQASRRLKNLINCA